MTNRQRSKSTGSVGLALAQANEMLANRPDMALAQAREVLGAIPGHPEAELIIGRALRRLGDLQGAREALGLLAAAQSRSAATAFELGLVALSMDDDGLAVSSLRKAAHLKPDAAPIWTALAAALRKTGEEEEAERADLAAVRASTKDPLLIKAALALSENRLEQAEPLLRARLKAEPTDIAAIRMLGELAWRLGRSDDAITLLRHTLELAPGFHPARAFLARIFNQIGDTRGALAEADALMAAEPDEPGHVLLRASLLVQMGDQEGARTLYEALLKRHPGQPRTWMNLGHVLKTIGRQADAIAAYREVIRINPSIGEAWWSLANLKTVKLDGADIAAIRTSLKRVSGNNDRYHLYFALGKALEDAVDADGAFAAYAKANALRRAELPYDPEDTRKTVDEHAAIFTRPFSAACAGGGCVSPDPIFIVGLPRSGSTLVEQILSSHSQVEGTMELPDLMMMAARLHPHERDGKPVPYAEVVTRLSEEARRQLGEEYIERTRSHRHTKRPFFIDKMPNNWQHIGLIRLILPNAKIIDARRHPVGCCFSGWKQHFARGQAFSYDLVGIGRYYRDYVRQMSAFDQVAPGHVHRVIYERMVADTRGEVERLLAYLGLPFEEACLSFWRNERAVRTASSEQVRTPIYKSSLDHWRRFERHLTPLIETLGSVIDAYPDVPADLMPKAGNGQQRDRLS